MSSVVSVILKTTLGLLVYSGRDRAAEELKDGDVTNEKLRNIIVRELGDINSKLKGIARKELLASITFFKEGIVYLENVKPNKEDRKKTQQGEDRVATPLKQDVGSSAAEACLKAVSLAQEMRSLQLTDQGNDAKDNFKQAREKAIEAFCDEALSTSDRILAMQFRILATILEKVDRLTDALPVCRLCLEELHSMPAVKKSLDVHLQQGFRSMFNKTEREDTIRSVCRMNRVIFDITAIVKGDTDFSLWPCVDLGKDKVDPLRDVRVTKTIEKEYPQYFRLKAWPFFQEGEETTMLKDWFITTNTKGQLIIVATDDNSECALLKVFDRYGNLLPAYSLPLKFPVTDSNGFSLPVIRDIASDRANNVFLLVQRTDLNGNLNITVIVFDEHANFQHEFDVKEGSHSFRIAVSDDNKVFVLVKVGEKRGSVQEYNFNGVLLNSIENESWETVIDMTSMDSEGGKIVVSGNPLDIFPVRVVFLFGEHGDVFSWHYVVSNCISHICFLHKTQHVAIESFLLDELLLYNKNGEVMREIKLNLSAFRYLGANAKALTVTTQGLVAMLATDEETGKRMIVIL